LYNGMPMLTLCDVSIIDSSKLLIERVSSRRQDQAAAFVTKTARRFAQLV